MLVRSCRVSGQAGLHGIRPRLFSSTCIRRDETNHYETLGLQQNASAGEIKKQFYKLSKANHPDLHPNEPTASERFVKISEAYAVLGSTEKRARYDRSITPASASTSPEHHHRGSYSSHTAGPAGGRPASGLRSKRTQFRGPPPSFFRNGGWGSQGAKRAEHASGSDAQQQQQQQQQTYAEPGTGPGGFTAGFDNDVPHFDQAGHFRTQEGFRRRRDVRGGEEGRTIRRGVEEDNSGGGMVAGFLVVSGVLGLAFGLSTIMSPATAMGTGTRRRDT